MGCSTNRCEPLYQSGSCNLYYKVALQKPFTQRPRAQTGRGVTRVEPPHPIRMVLYAINTNVNQSIFLACSRTRAEQTNQAVISSCKADPTVHPLLFFESTVFIPKPFNSTNGSCHARLRPCWLPNTQGPRSHASRPPAAPSSTQPASWQEGSCVSQLR